MSRALSLVGIGIGAALAYAVVRHIGGGRGHRMPGGIVKGDAGPTGRGHDRVLGVSPGTRPRHERSTRYAVGGSVEP
jgi:hypothetical protein